MAGRPSPWLTTPRAARTHAPRARRRCRHRHRLPTADKSSMRGLLPFWPRTNILSSHSQKGDLKLLERDNHGSGSEAQARGRRSDPGSGEGRTGRRIGSRPGARHGAACDRRRQHRRQTHRQADRQAARRGEGRHHPHHLGGAAALPVAPDARVEHRHRERHPETAHRGHLRRRRQTHGQEDRAGNPRG